MKRSVRLLIALLTILLPAVLCRCAGKTPARAVPETVGSPKADSPAESVAEPESYPPETDEETVLETDPDGSGRLPLSGVTIVLDPGHGRFPENFQEPLAPWSDDTKKAFSTGTAGKYMSEAELVFKLAMMLRPRLEELGADVYMTREDENSISNVERAEFANNLDADLAFRIHVDGNENTEVYGMSMLVHAKGTIGEKLEAVSRTYGEKILSAMLQSTGAKDRGIRERSDLTGFNWSKVPVVLVECGFMSNPEEDALLSSESYQELLVEGMLKGISDCFTE